jgi:hypothetical protein
MDHGPIRFEYTRGRVTASPAAACSAAAVPVIGFLSGGPLSGVVPYGLGPPPADDCGIAYL